MRGKRESKIYSDSYQLTISVFHRTKGYPKQLRPTLGRRAEEASLDLMDIVRSMNKEPKKLKLREIHENATVKLDTLRILLQVAYDMKAMGAGAWGELSELTALVGKKLDKLTSKS